MGASGGVQLEGLTFPQAEQPGDGVHVTPRQDHITYRAVAQTPAGVKRRRFVDLLPKIRGGVEQAPISSVSAYSEARLGAGRGGRVAGASATTTLRIGIPLGEAAAGGRPQDNDLHDRSGFEVRAGVAVDFSAEGDFSDFGFLPGHGSSPSERETRLEDERVKRPTLVLLPGTTFRAKGDAREGTFSSAALLRWSGEDCGA